MATEARVIKTPYDEEIARIEGFTDAQGYITAGVVPTLQPLYLKREGWLACYPIAFEDGIEEAKTNPDLYGLAAPAKGV